MGFYPHILLDPFLIIWSHKNGHSNIPANIYLFQVKIETLKYNFMIFLQKPDNSDGIIMHDYNSLI